MKIIRQFDVFEKTSDYIKEEIPITDFDIEVVRGKVKLGDGDPQLYYQYKVEGELQEYFEGLGYKFDTEKNDYFLCCYQDT